MLYQRWLDIVRDRRDELALHELASEQRWTFDELKALSDAPLPPDTRLAFPTGISPGFIVTVLKAWRSGVVVCPSEESQACPEFARLPPNCVHLKWTSATSGAPRAVAFTAAQLIADAANIVATMKLRPDWPNLGVISLAHSYGFSNLVLPLLLHGIPLVLLNTTLPEAVRKVGRVVGDVAVPAVPALWRAWHDGGALSSNIRLAISAGAPLPLSLEVAVFNSHGIKIHNFYGATECGGIAYDRSNVPRIDASCAGSPLENVRVRVDDDGCLVVRSPATGESYWPESDSALAQGQYRTSDLAELRDGLVFLRGRATDLINIAGRKVSPETIEHALLRTSQVQDCLVFGVPSPGAERTEVIAACVVARSDVSAETLKQFLLANLPSWQVPREWIFVDSLQVNPRGKRSRADWRRWFMARKEKC